MKLKIAQLFSQRDERWASIILGNNKLPQYNIGNYGCLITSLGMYINNQPNNVNQVLKDNGGFQKNDGNFTGDATSLGLKQTYISAKYPNAVPLQAIAKMKDLLDNRYPLLCEIDFNPATNGEEMHFVLVIGYEGDQFFIADPWTGTVVSLDVYGGASRAVIQFRAYDKKLDEDIAVSMITIPTADRDKLINRSTTAKEVAEYLEISNPDNAQTKDYTTVIAGIKSATTACNNSLTIKETDLQIANQQIENKTQELARKDDERQSNEKLLNAQIDNLNKQLKLASQPQGDLQGKIKVLQGQVDTLSREKGKLLLQIAGEIKKENKLIALINKLFKR